MNKKLLNGKVLVILVIVIAGGLVVAYNPRILDSIINFFNPNGANQEFKYDNATLLPPFPTAKYSLSGGNQYADLHFAMDVNFDNDSYQYTNMRFLGTISNMSALTNDTQINNVNSFTFTTNVADCLYGQSQNPVYNNKPKFTPNETSSVTAGDINGNSQDEYIGVYSTECKNNFDSKLTVLEWNATSQSFYTWTEYHLALYNPAIMAVDLKGNGHSDLVVAGFSNKTSTDLQLMIFDFSPSNVTVTDPGSLVIVNKTITNLNLVPNQQIVMDSGNIDSNLDQEFFIYGESTNRMFTCGVFSYNFKDQTLTSITSWTDADLGRPVFASLLQNGKEQLIIPKREELIPPDDIYSSPPFYTQNTHTNESGFIYEIGTTASKKIAYFPYRGIVGAGNIKGTGSTFIILLDYCFGTCQNNIHLFKLDSSYVLNNENGAFNPLPETEHYSAPISYSYNPPINEETGFSTFRSTIKILTSDINFDGIPEIMIMGPTTTRFYLIRADTLVHGDNSGNLIDPYSPSYNVGYIPIGSTFYGFSNASTTGNFYNQSTLVDYQQVSYLSNGKPTVLAVIAAAPTKSGISQNYGNTQTSFGQSTSSSSSTENSFGYSFGAKVTVGYEGDVSLFGVKIAEFGASISASFDYASTQSQKVTHTVQYSNTWSTDSEHNGVVYSAIEYKNWNYTILASSNPSFNGKTMVFSYPYYVGIFKFDADAFDQANPGYNINSKTFNHTIGNPTTYPTEAQATGLTSSGPIKFKASALRPVNQGGSADDQGIDVSTELTSTNSVEYTVGASATAKVGAGGAYVEAEASSGVTWGESSEVSIGKGTSYSASVGQISSTTDWNQWSYGWGLFVYLKQRPDLNISYQVIDFFTGNFGPGYSSAYHTDSRLQIKPAIETITITNQKLEKIYTLISLYRL